MSKGNSNAAEELTASPELKLVEGESAEVQPEEITALLDEMARQNAEQVAAEDDAATAQTGDAPAEVSQAAAPETMVEDQSASSEPAKVAEGALAEEVQPSVSDTVEDQTTPDLASGESQADEASSDSAVGPSFTMEDVMRAASESTSFTVDEIAQFESQPAEEPESPNELVAAEETVAAEHPKASAGEYFAAFEQEESRTEARRTPQAEVVEPRAQAKLKPAVRVPKLRDWKAWAPWIAGPAAAAVVFLFVAGRLSGVEGKMSTRDKELRATLAEVSDSIESLNARFGSFDRAQTDKSHSAGKSEPKDSGSHEFEPRDMKSGQAENSSSHGGGSSGEHKTSHSEHKAPIGEDDLKQSTRKPIPTAKPEHFAKDHFDSGAQVEGFKVAHRPPSAKRFSSRLLAMGGTRPAAKRKVTGAVQHGRPDGGTIKVWLDGKLVTKR